MQCPEKVAPANPQFLKVYDNSFPYTLYLHLSKIHSAPSIHRLFRCRQTGNTLENLKQALKTRRNRISALISRVAGSLFFLKAWKGWRPPCLFVNPHLCVIFQAIVALKFGILSINKTLTIAFTCIAYNQHQLASRPTCTQTCTVSFLTLLASYD